MCRRPPHLGILVLLLAIGGSGCRPQQPFYLFEDGDLSHYKGMATEIEYPDLRQPPNPEAAGAAEPFTIDPAKREVKEIQGITLEEAIHTALKNNKVMRTIGGQVFGPPEFITRNPEVAPTIWDVALAESNPRAGVEAALAAFDAQFHSIVKWEKFREPRNFDTSGFRGQFFPAVRHDDIGTFQNELRKVTAAGGVFSIAHDFLYSESNSPTRAYNSDWTTMLRIQARQPLLRGAGVEFNRIAGPGAVPGVNNGVVLARINTDVALAEFEKAVRNLVADVEIAYWELYYAYRALDAVKSGRDSGLRTWQQVHEKYKVGMSPVHEEAQARQQYFQFKTAMERALTNLFQAESRLRYLMGLAPSDGRLFRPETEPTTAPIKFSWAEVLAEALAYSPELREHRWTVKRRELELIAAKNHLLPQLDFLAMYQWHGLGNRLADADGGSGDFRSIGSNAYQNLTGGGFGNWMLGLELNMPIGFRREMAGVRNAQLALARERARLHEAELEVSHQLAYALRELDSNLVLTQTNFNRRIAAADEAESAWQRYLVGLSARTGPMAPGKGQEGTLADVLDAQRRQAEADADYYRTLVDYNKAIMQVHHRKGTLLEYNGIQLAEGPWPAKAYFDAVRRARSRDASIYLDYGFTRPRVVSQGPDAGRLGSGPVLVEQGDQTPGLPDGRSPVEPAAEPVPTPPGVPDAPTPEPQLPDAQSGALRQPVSSSGWSVPGAPNAPKTAVGQQQAGKSKSAGGQRGYDIGSLDLGVLAGKSQASLDEHNPDKSAVRISAGGIEAAAHAEPLVGPKLLDASGAKPAATAATEQQTNKLRKVNSSSGLRWTDPAGATSHESNSHPPPVETDRPASGWKRVER